MEAFWKTIRLGSCLSPDRRRQIKERLEAFRRPVVRVPDPPVRARVGRSLRLVEPGREKSTDVRRLDWIEWGFVRDARPGAQAD
jgi:hypothetical protein